MWQWYSGQNVCVRVCLALQCWGVPLPTSLITWRVTTWSTVTAVRVPPVTPAVKVRPYQRYVARGMPNILFRRTILTCKVKWIFTHAYSTIDRKCHGLCGREAITLSQAASALLPRPYRNIIQTVWIAQLNVLWLVSVTPFLSACSMCSSAVCPTRKTR